ncbi:hypothetical protein SOASR031_06770 [Leminorella grimontii]|nr:hypothetical protein SOASR031_06770 [Leminorella grimontii]
MIKNININGLVITSLNCIASILFSYFLTESLTNNNDALNLVANVFSILSGFLLLVITMSGDNASITNNLSQLDLAKQEAGFIIRFNKYYTLFLLYIITLALIFIYYLLSKNKSNHGDIIKIIQDVIAYIISFLTCFSFIQSTFIPLKIRELFKEKRKLNKN